MNVASDIAVTLEKIRSDIEEVTGYPTWSERLQETTNDIDVLVYIDDKQPWILNDKNLMLNLILSVRGRMTGITSVVLESNVQGIALNILGTYMADDSRFEFPGAHATFVKVEGGYEKDSKGENSQRYVVNQNFRLY